MVRCLSWRQLAANYGRDAENLCGLSTLEIRRENQFDPFIFYSLEPGGIFREKIRYFIDFLTYRAGSLVYARVESGRDAAREEICGLSIIPSSF